MEWEKERKYVVDLKRFADANGDECFGAQTLNGEGDAAGYVSDGSVRFENSHFRTRREKNNGNRERGKE